MSGLYSDALDLCLRANAENGIAGLISQSDAIIVGYSGGADSTLLLRMIRDLAPGKRIVAAHLNHGIRGSEADRDMDFCRETAESLGIEFVSEKADVPALAAESGDGIEEAARKARYAFFGRCADKIGGRVLIATAHNADDNLETVIMNMLRGCGLNGLTGIHPVRDGNIIRPILSLPSSEIREICRLENFAFRVDSTNTDTDYTRNYVRAEIAPRLRHVTDHPETQIMRMCASLRDDDTFITAEVERLFGGGVGISLARSSPCAVCIRAIMREYRRALNTDKTLSRTNVSDIYKLIMTGSDGASVSLPGGVSAFIDGDRLVIGTPYAAAPFLREAADGANDFPEYGFRLVIGSEPDGDGCENIYKLSIRKSLRCDKINGRLVIRSRRDGDVYRFGGMTRKVKKLLSERKIPQSKRCRLPVICCGDDIVWIPGFPVADGYEAKDGDGLDIIYTEYDRH